MIVLFMYFTNTNTLHFIHSSEWHNRYNVYFVLTCVFIQQIMNYWCFVSLYNAFKTQDNLTAVLTKQKSLTSDKHLCTIRKFYNVSYSGCTLV